MDVEDEVVGLISTKSFEIFAAKSSFNNFNLWLPLWMHAKDTAGMMVALLDNWLPEKIVSELLTYIPGKNFDLLKKTCSFIGYIHDIGKITQVFQSKIEKTISTLRNDLLEHGFDLKNYFPNGSLSPHAKAGESILNNLGLPLFLCCIVGSHHGKPGSNADEIKDDFLRNNKDGNNCENYYGSSSEKEKWLSIYKDYINWCLDACGFSELNDLPEYMPAESQILLTGLLIIADWLASNQAYFPLIGVSTYGDESYYPSRIDRAWANIAFPSRISECSSMSDEDFFERFGFMPNEVQQCFLNNLLEEPGLYILEAPMGCGKTEASLGAAEALISKTLAGGVFFGLPTQATANGILPRVKYWAEANSRFGQHAFRLLHSNSSFNCEYETIFHGKANICDDADGVFVHSWMEGRQQALLSDFVVGTVDQALFCSLKQKHFMMRHLGIAGKVVIIDECHAYDSYMMAFMESLLNWLGKYGVSVFLLSATLPYSRRKAFVEAYIDSDKLITNVNNWDISNGYPLITCVGSISHRLIQQKVILNNNEKKEIQIIYVKEIELFDTLLDKLDAGGCAAIIVNTIAYSQKLAKRLEEKFPEYKIVLLHSAFLPSDRAMKEKEILELTGKNSTLEIRNKVILVGTQVLEQSLDYDVDFMISEICPIDLLLQRMGRLHRHKRICRPNKVSKPIFGILNYE